MCTVISTGQCTCSSSGGVTVDEVLVVIGGTVAIGLGYQIVGLSPEFFGVAGVTMLAVAPNWTRRCLGRGVKWARRALWRACTHRRKTVPAQPLALPDRTWRVALYATDAGVTRQITEGTLTGPWANAAELEAEAIARYLAHPDRAPGRIGCRAELLQITGGAR